MKMFKFAKTSRKSQSGFTLVELSIVLVIIGLIISSVLVGQDLVRSAELRSTITQLEGFNSAVGTFRGKYNGLPGDLRGANRFGFVGDGNEDGVLTAANTALGLAAVENVFFWNHLGSSGAALIAGSYNGVAIETDNASTAIQVAANLPAAKAGNYWGVFGGHPTVTAEVAASTAEAGTNFYILGVTGSTTISEYTTAATLTSLEAQNVDSKVDDGRPSTGTVRARGASATLPDTAPSFENSAAGTGTTCVNSSGTYLAPTSALRYNTVGNSSTATCTLRFKMPL